MNLMFSDVGPFSAPLSSCTRLRPQWTATSGVPCTRGAAGSGGFVRWLFPPSSSPLWSVAPLSSSTSLPSTTTRLALYPLEAWYVGVNFLEVWMKHIQKYERRTLTVDLNRQFVLRTPEKEKICYPDQIVNYFAVTLNHGNAFMFVNTESNLTKNKRNWYVRFVIFSVLPQVFDTLWVKLLSSLWPKEASSDVRLLYV